MASEHPKLFARMKSSKRGSNLIKSGIYSNKLHKRHRAFEASSNTETVSSSSCLQAQILFDEPSCSGLNNMQSSVETSSLDNIFAEPLHYSTPKQKRARIELFPEDSADENLLSPNSLITRYYSLEESPPPLVTEQHRPIGHDDSHISFLTGRRIVDIAHVISESRKLENHECKVKPPGHLAFDKEDKMGFSSNIVFKCTKCGMARTICTNPTDEYKDNVNLAAVWGTVATGNGYYGMEELLSTMNVPVMTAKTFGKYHQEVGEIWFKSLTKAIEDAAATEYRHAQEIGTMNGDIGEITVSLDGGWSQRSYNHGYTAKSGVAVIIGQHTKQILHLGVRNKYCSICAIAARKNCDAQSHQCYRNWTGSSPAMEANIVVEGFQSSESMFKLRYTKFIGDGDSSVRKRIEESVPYSRSITKIDCTNHLLKNIKKHLYKFSSENATHKKILSDRKINSITKYCHKLIVFHANLSEPSVSDLQGDLEHVVEHSFGDHSRCRDVVCNDAGSSAIESLFKSMSGTSKARIKIIIGTLSSKAQSLIENATSNAAEEYMHILAKFNGGKQVFYGRRNSFYVRCYGAGLAFQCGPDWSNTAWKDGLGRSPGAPTKKMISKRKKSNARARLYKNRYRNFRCVFPSTENKATGQKDYGPNSQQLDLPDEAVIALIDAQVTSLCVTAQQQLEIERRTCGQSENPSWMEERSLRLTASFFGTVCKRRAPPGPLVHTILYQTLQNNQAIEYGKLNERVAIEEYIKKTGLIVNNCGLFVSVTPNSGYLAASPDGIIDSHKLVEVKCPFSARNMTPIDAATKLKTFCSTIVNGQLRLKRTHNYYYQIQGQLHCTGRKFCDFIIWTPLGIDIETIPYNGDFIIEMLPKLRKFYYDELGPELVDSRKKRCMHIRNMPAAKD